MDGRPSRGYSREPAALGGGGAGYLQEQLEEEHSFKAIRGPLSRVLPPEPASHAKRLLRALKRRLEGSIHRTRISGGTMSSAFVCMTSSSQ